MHRHRHIELATPAHRTAASGHEEAPWTAGSGATFAPCVMTHENRHLAGETVCLVPGPAGGRNLFRPGGGQEVWRQPRQRA